MRDYFESRDRARALLAEGGVKDAVQIPDDALDRSLVAEWLEREQGFPRSVIERDPAAAAAAYFGKGTTFETAYDRIAEIYTEQANLRQILPPPPTAGSGSGGRRDIVDIASDLVINAGKRLAGDATQALAGAPSGLYATAGGVLARENPQLRKARRRELGAQGAMRRLLLQAREADLDYGGDRAIWDAYQVEIGKAQQELDAAREEYSALIAKAKEGPMDAREVVARFAQELATDTASWRELYKEAYKTEPTEGDPAFVGFVQEITGAVGQIGAAALSGGAVFPGMMTNEVLDDYKDATGKDISTMSPEDWQNASMAIAVYSSLGSVMERLGLKAILTPVEKTTATLTAREVIKRMAAQSVRAGVPEGLTEAGQGQLLSILARLNYDTDRPLVEVKKRLMEFSVAAVAGGLFGGGVQMATDAGQAQANQEALADMAKEKPLTREDFRLMRENNTDAEITKRYGQGAVTEMLIKGMNGDRDAQNQFNGLRWGVIPDAEVTIDAFDGVVFRDNKKEFIATQDGAFVEANTPELQELASRIETQGKRIATAEQAGQQPQVYGSLAYGARVMIRKMPDGTFSVLDLDTKTAMPKIATHDEAIRIAEQRIGQSLEAGRVGSLEEALEVLRRRTEETGVEVRDVESIAVDALLAESPGAGEALRARWAAEHPGVTAGDAAVDDVSKTAIFGMSAAETVGNVRKYVAIVSRKGDVTTAIEEVSESFLKRALSSGAVTMRELVDWKHQWEEIHGARQFNDSTVGVIEWFSNMAIDFTITDGAKTTMIENSKLLRDLCPSWFGSFVARMRVFFADVVRRAAAIVEMRRQGKLSPRLEALLEASIGAATGQEQTGQAAEPEDAAGQTFQSRIPLSVTSDIGTPVQQALALAAQTQLAQRHAQQQMLDAQLARWERVQYSDRLLWRGARYIGMPVLSRIRRISPDLFGRLRKYIRDEAAETGEAFEVLDSFHKLVKREVGGRRKRERQRKLFLAMSNSDVATVQAILSPEAFHAYRDCQDMFAQLRQLAIDNGYEVGEVADYWPRHVRDMAALRGYFSGTPEEQTLVDEMEKARRGRVLTPDEEAVLLSNLVSGAFRKKSGKPGSLKGRTIEAVPQDLYELAYADPFSAAEKAITDIIRTTNLRRLLGKSIVETKVPGLPNRVDIDESIGAVIRGDPKHMALTQAELRELQDSMHAMLGVKSMPAALRTWRTMTYIAVMGKGFTTTVLQLADIVPAIIGGGYGNTIASVAHIFGKDEVTVGRDLRMARYQFGDMTNAIEAENIASRAADAVFTATGLKHLGRGTQQVLVNSVLRRYRAAARRGKFSDRQMRSLLDYFSGDKAEVERLAADLAAGVKSERVLLLGWNILSDWHPVSMGELPAGYTNHPVGRIWYILKSYTIKMLDNYRREGIDEMRIAVQAKDYRRFLDSFFRLMHMMVLLYVSGCTIDTINDYIVRGLEPDDDVLWDNIFKIVGISRYAQYRAWQEGFYAGAMAQFAPPVLTPFDYARRDVAAFLKAQEEGEDFGLRDMEMTRMIPLFGDWIFWRGEAGQEKVEKVKQRRED